MGTLDAQLEAELEAEVAEYVTLHEDEFVCALDEAVKEKPAVLAPSLRLPVENQGARGALSLGSLIQAGVRIAFGVAKRYKTKREHGFYPTVVEEILRATFLADLGAWGWQGMKNSARRCGPTTWARPTTSSPAAPTSSTACAR